LAIDKDKLDDLENRRKTARIKKMEKAEKVIATRDRIERDYIEDQIYVTFKTSAETKRTIVAKRPTNSEMIQIIQLFALLTKFQAENDYESLMELSKIYERLHDIAANLSVDKKLDKEFWSKKVSNASLQDFINKVILASQQGIMMPEEEMQSFR